MSGFYLMHRGWMDNPALMAGREPFCRRAAWAWLIEAAAWADRPVDLAGGTVSLRRGQLAHSIRFLADAWKWHRSAVERLLERLATEAMIETATERGRLVITICNYEHYQEPKRIPEIPPETAPETRARQRRDSTETNTKEGKERKEGKEKKEESDSCVSAIDRGETVVVDSAPQPVASEPVAAKAKKKKAAQQDMPAEMLGDFERWWSEYPKVRQVAKGDARPAYRRARTKATASELLEGLRRMRFTTAAHYILYPATWLNRERWLDSPEAHQVDPDAGRERADPLAWLKKRQAAEAQEEMTLEGEVIDSTILEPEWKI